jgi:outer membrane receptor protein involved in Fe transport
MLFQEQKTRTAILQAAMHLLLATAVYAGTTGKIAGRVLDRNKEPLPGANVQLLGTVMGAATDPEGYYTIINIPPGAYIVQFSFLGYQSLQVQDVLVNADKTTTQNAELKESVIAGETVTVTAERPVVETNLTSSVATVTSKEISLLPVQELNDVVNLQAGVIDGHFRGGRLGEVQFQVNGVTVNNSYDNSNSLRIDRSLLQEVQVISGTFDAEYGQALSGVVNAVLKSGTERFNCSAEVFTSDYVFSGGDRRRVSDKFRPFSRQNYQLSISGPTILPNTFFVASARRFIDNGYIDAIRRFAPTDTFDFQNNVPDPTPAGDGEEVPLGYTHEWSGLVKITNRSLPGMELAYQAIFNDVEAITNSSGRSMFQFRLNPEGRPIQRTFSLVHGLDWTHTLSSKTFYNLSFRQNLFDYTDYVYEDVNDPRYDLAGVALGRVDFEMGAVVQGVDLTRFKQRTNTFVLKGALTSQVTRTHQLKLGGELQVSELVFGTPGFIVDRGVRVIERHIDEQPIFPGISEFHPLSFSIYGQDQMEWNDLVIRAGVRGEYFDARSTLPSNLRNPANDIPPPAPQSIPVPTEKRFSLVPRLGVSYPISTDAALFFAYGHFRQLPPLGQIFNNADYSVLVDLQAERPDFRVLGNPNIKPERTIQYEFGYKHALSDFLGLDISAFYKDIRDLLGVEFITTYNGAEYARFTNIDFGDVLGFTVAVDQRRIGPISTMIDYTWQRAQGNASDPRETATRAEAGEDPRPRQIPLNWDQRHTLNCTVTLEKPGAFAISSVIRYGSGQPYTPAFEIGFGQGLEANSGTKPAFVLVDLRGEKFFRLGNMRLSLFARVFNLFDARFSNGPVFNTTGSPYYSLDPKADEVALADPIRLFPPRRIEIGFTINSSL